MYGFIRGKVDSVDSGSFVVDCNGVGYIIYATTTLLARLVVGQEFKVVTHMVVKEDDISIYGFVDASEKAMFLNLIGVSGVGARSAIGILSGISTKDLALLIMTKDATALTKVKGIGRKTAERIILELRGKFEGEIDGGAYSAIGGDIRQDAIQALISLGFRAVEAGKMLENVNGTTVEELVTSALKSKKS